LAQANDSEVDRLINQAVALPTALLPCFQNDIKAAINYFNSHNKATKAEQK